MPGAKVFQIHFWLWKYSGNETMDKIPVFTDLECWHVAT